MLTAQGLLGDDSIPDEERRKAQQERLQRLYHNTQVLLSHYRDIAWALECFPEAVAQELEEPFDKLDTLLDRMDAEAGMGNRKLESRVESLRKSRLLLDRINEALTVLKKEARQRPPAVRADLPHLHCPGEAEPHRPAVPAGLVLPAVLPAAGGSHLHPFHPAVVGAGGGAGKTCGAGGSVGLMTTFLDRYNKRNKITPIVGKIFRQSSEKRCFFEWFSA